MHFVSSYNLSFCRAQPGGRLSQIQNGRKRRISDYQSSNTNAASTMPSVKEDREDLAWIMCVLMMAARQLALVNKTGQTNFEINIVCRTYVEWVRNIIQQHFMPFFSAMLFLSYDRVIAGYLTRQVATTFMATCARHYAECDSTTDANAQILLDMETAPVTLQTCNLAICNAITHMVDTNLLMVNQLIRDKLDTPVVPVEFIIALLHDEPMEMGTTNYEALFSWLSAIVQNRQHEIECVMGYVAVNKLGTLEDYNSKEAYLESYFGIAKNNYYTYLTAVRECCSKTFDLASFLSLERPMLDFTRFAGRLGVGGDGMLQAYHQNPLQENARNTFLFTQNANPVQQDGNPANGSNNNVQRGGITKCWVNVIQHLLLTALQGTKDLHADNMFSFGANLTEFILSRCAPLQSIPAGVCVHESFVHAHEEVVPLHSLVTDRPEYFVRTVNDHCAMENGMASELPAILGPHPPEDVMHLGSWIQLYTIIHNGMKPEIFECFPVYNGRPPELVIGRRYPLLGVEARGTIMLTTEGTAHFTTGEDTERWEILAPIRIKGWWDFLCKKQLMVAPLVFRHFAVFTSEDRTPWITMRHADRQFVNQDGQYLLTRSNTEQELVPFLEAHNRLLPIGAHLLVKTHALAPYAISAPNEWILGSLRYPDSRHEEDDPYRIYLSIRTRQPRTLDVDVCVVSVAVQDCHIPHEEERQRRNAYDYACIANHRQ